MQRRYFLYTGTGFLGAIAMSCQRSTTANAQDNTGASTSTYEIAYSEAQWRQRLTPEQFNVLREHGTEPPHSSSLNEEYGEGTYTCAGCDLPVFTSATKFDSGTGWPSFYAPIEGAIGTSTDRAFGIVRTEVHCRRCGGHLGHVFEDGPPPTGLRYCMNGVALKFVEA